jgi:hypothetical protein
LNQNNFQKGRHMRGLFHFLENNFKNTKRKNRHNDTGEDESATDREECLFLVEIEHAGCKGASPSAGARKWDADEENEGEVDTIAGFLLEFFAAFFAFFKAPFTEFITFLPFPS